MFWVKGANLEAPKKHLIFPFQSGSLLSLGALPYVSFLLLKCTAAVKCKWLIRKIVRVAVRRLFFYLAAAAGEWWEREMMIRWYTRHPSTCMAANFAASARALSLGGSFSFILAHSLGAAASYLKCASAGDVREKLLSNRKISYGIFNTLCTQAHKK